MGTNRETHHDMASDADIAFLLGITPQRVSQIGLKDDDCRCNECQRFYDEDNDERSD